MTFGSISKIFAFAALSIFPYRYGTAQSASTIADDPGSALISGIPQHTGCHLPAAGRVRGLVLFIQTANDDLGDAAWKLNEMPSWAERFKARLRDYFGYMSNGRLQLELDVHPSIIVTHATEHSYLNAGMRLGQANRDILQSLDAALDYAPYDNWRSVGNAYNVQPEPDNEIELIITLYRRVTFASFFGYSGVSDLGFEGYLFVDGGARRIYGGSGEYNDARASGVTVVRTPGSGIVMDEDWAVNVSIHELMHKFFGEGHPTDLYGGLGVLSHGAGGVAMSSFERHTLGYINYRVIPHGKDTAITLSDYVTTGDAAVLALPEAPNWHYAFEYRRRLSQYDTAPADGVFIYRIYTPTGSSQKQLQVISAAGAHQWALDSVTGKPFRLHPDPIGGYNEYQKIPIDGKTYYADGWWGEPKSAFTPDRPNFTTWHNPSPDFIRNRDTIHTNLFITVEKMDGREASLRIRFQTPAILNEQMPSETDFKLHPAYPNPFTGASRLSVEFDLPEAGHAVLRIMDSFGRTVEKVVDGFLPAGRHNRSIDARELPSGVYWQALEFGSGTARSPFLIAR